MKLLILGGTGGTGKQIVSQALEAGHDVTVLARDRAKCGPEQPRQRVIVGDLQNGAALADAMRGQDAVISVIGRGYSFKSEHLIEHTVPGIIAAMKAAGVRRLLFTSALGVGQSFSDSPLLPRLFFRTLLRGIYADKLIGEQLIRSSGLDWTIVQPSQMTDGPLTRTYRSGEHLALSGMPKISRADVAHFLLSAAGDPATIGKTLLVSN
jgi:putative NADH-flavin reductase